MKARQNIQNLALVILPKRTLGEIDTGLFSSFLQSQAQVNGGSSENSLIYSWTFLRLPPKPSASKRRE